MYITRAKIADMPAIAELASKYGSKLTIYPHLFNKRDIALQARNKEGEVVGFVWAGLMGKNKIAYIDNAVIHPDYHKKGVMQMLYKELLTMGDKLGVEFIFGIIRQDEYHDAAAVNALKMAFGADRLPYTYVRAQMAHIQSELKSLGVSNGR